MQDVQPAGMKEKGGKYVEWIVHMDSLNTQAPGRKPVWLIIG